MIKMTRSLQHWLFINHPDILPLVLFGQVELFTDEMQAEYLGRCKTDEGKPYLKVEVNIKENNMKNSIVTWNDIYEEFLSSTGIDREFISDYRPCEQPYFGVRIPMAILVWLKDGGQLIYMKKGD